MANEDPKERKSFSRALKHIDNDRSRVLQGIEMTEYLKTANDKFENGNMGFISGIKPAM